MDFTKFLLTHQTGLKLLSGGAMNYGLPMGLSNSPAAFQRIMDHEIQEAGLTGSVACFIDDLLVYSDTLWCSSH